MNKLLPSLEQICLAILVIGFILQLNGTPIAILIMLGLGGLGVVFFLSAYRPLDVKPQENERMGFNELLGLSIIPKVLWIGSAITVMGILFYMMQIGNGQFLGVLYIGGLTVIIATLILLGLKAIGTKYLNTIFPILFRALPTLLVAAYIILG